MIATLLPTNLPPPLRGADGPSTFTYDSIHQRLPLIVDELLAHNSALSHAARGALLRLRDEVAATAPATALAADAAHCLDGEWGPALEAQRAAGGTWDSAPWWWVENFFYARVRAAVGGAGAPDPFAVQKSRALDDACGAFAASVLPLAAEAPTPAMLRRALLRSLWGNRADLSLHTVASLAAGAGAAGADDDASRLLVDDVDAAVALVTTMAAPGGRVSLVLDNCGLELLSDLVLTDALLRGGCAAVMLHAKDRPVFVSDAMPADVRSHVSWLAGGGAAAAALAARLESGLADGRLEIATSPFWASPLAAWEAPAEVVAALAPMALTVFKGDGERV